MHSLGIWDLENVDSVELNVKKPLKDVFYVIKSLYFPCFTCKFTFTTLQDEHKPVTVWIWMTVMSSAYRKPAYIWLSYIKQYFILENMEIDYLEHKRRLFPHIFLPILLKSLYGIPGICTLRGDYLQFSSGLKPKN